MLQAPIPRSRPGIRILGSTVIFGLLALVTWNWHAPQTAGGWAAIMGSASPTTIAVLALFVSIKRIGPFRSALIMYLEPLLSTVLSAPLLGEFITPLASGGRRRSCWPPWFHSSSGDDVTPCSTSW